MHFPSLWSSGALSFQSDTGINSTSVAYAQRRRQVIGWNGALGGWSAGCRPLGSSRGESHAPVYTENRESCSQNDNASCFRAATANRSCFRSAWRRLARRFLLEARKILLRLSVGPSGHTAENANVADAASGCRFHQQRPRTLVEFISRAVIRTQTFGQFERTDVAHTIGHRGLDRQNGGRTT